MGCPQGLSEVKRIRAAMEGVKTACRFDGTLAEFSAHINSDPQFVAASKEELLSGYQRIMDHVQAQLPKFFNVLPSTECTLRAMKPEQAVSAPAAYYYAGTADGKRPGIFWANTDNLPARKTYEMEALTLHEAIPGHHLQTTLAIESNDLAVFQRHLEDRRYGEAPGRFPLYRCANNAPTHRPLPPTSPFGVMQRIRGRLGVVLRGSRPRN